MLIAEVGKKEVPTEAGLGVNVNTAVRLPSARAGDHFSYDMTNCAARPKRNNILRGSPFYIFTFCKTHSATGILSGHSCTRLSPRLSVANDPSASAPGKACVSAPNEDPAQKSPNMLISKSKAP
jgi:hypothetical protein